MDTLKNISFNVTVKVNNPDKLDATIGEATSLFRNVRELAISKPDNFEISEVIPFKKNWQANIAAMTAGGALSALSHY